MKLVNVSSVVLQWFFVLLVDIPFATPPIWSAFRSPPSHPILLPSASPRAGCLLPQCCLTRSPLCCVVRLFPLLKADCSSIALSRLCSLRSSCRPLRRRRLAAPFWTTSCPCAISLENTLDSATSSSCHPHTHTEDPLSDTRDSTHRPLPPLRHCQARCWRLGQACPIWTSMDWDRH